MGAGALVTAVLVLMLFRPPLRLRCPNGAIPERLEVGAAITSHVGVIGRITMTEDSLDVGPSSVGPSTSRSLTTFERQELVRAIEHPPKIPEAGPYIAAVAVEMTCDGKALRLQEARGERPSSPPSFADVVAHPSWDRFAQAVGALDPRPPKTLATALAVFRLISPE